MNNFFGEIFDTSYKQLHVSNKAAEQVLSQHAEKLLITESVNIDALQDGLNHFLSTYEKTNQQIAFDANCELSRSLSNSLKARQIDNRLYSKLSETCDEDRPAINPFQQSLFKDNYLSALETHRRDLSINILANIESQKPVVVFTAKKVYFNQLRLSKVLRDHGYKTMAIVFDTQMTQHQEGFFDKVLYTDLLSFLLFLNKLDRSILLHTQGWLFRYHIPVLIDMYKSPSCKQIIEMMDSQSFYLPESTVDNISEPMKKAWGENALENHQLQLACENYIVHNADGVIFNGDESYREPLVKFDSEYLRNKHLAFSALPLRDFFYVSHHVNKHKRLVFVGGVPPLLPSRPHELFGDSQLVNLVKKLVDNGCYLDIYNNPLIAPESEYKLLYPDFMELADKHESFNFYYGDSPQYINERISKYDIGLMVYDFCGTFSGDLHFKHLIPTKLFSYLEAGLPVLVSDRFKAVCDIVKEYRIGVIVSQREIDLIPEIIDMIDIAELKRNVLVAREELQMHNNIHKLTGFYQQVMA